MKVKAAMRLNALITVLIQSMALLCLDISASMAGERPNKGGTISPAAIYHNYCSVCHGDRGDGRSRASGSLNPPPRDFSSANNLGRDAMVTIVTHGKSGTAMVGWKTQLTANEIEAVVDYIRRTFMIVALDPRLQQGKLLYAHNCIVCHGERGQGSSLPVGGSVPPKNLASPQARAELSRERMIASVSHGRPGTAMAAFAGRLSPQEIEAIVDYVRAALMIPETETISGTHAYGGRVRDESSMRSQKLPAPITADMSLPMPNALIGSAQKGKAFFDGNCATCHGVKGDGKGPRAYFINPKPRSLISAESKAIFNRPVIFAAVSMGKLGTEMPAWSKVLTAQEIADVSEYVFRSFIRPAGTVAKK
ncbi:MAG: c-type cytochrome [Rhodocyclaceae bacterium]|jgi:mono/diheme cytochrome c family protein|nr:c-type cytochrome [Rhodocyclaceae bacterium]